MRIGMVPRTIGRQVFNSPQSFSSLSSCDAYGRRWWLEDHVYIRAAAPWAHEAAPKPAESEAKALRPDQRVHVQFGLEVDRWSRMGVSTVPHRQRARTRQLSRYASPRGSGTV